MNRARRGKDLFVDKADYQQFIDLHSTISPLSQQRSPISVGQSERNTGKVWGQHFVPELFIAIPVIHHDSLQFGKINDIL
jgi:hypothetical protein